MHYLIRDLNKNEKPREKLFKYGVENLTDVELLAIILRSGGKGISALDLARDILNRFGDFSGLVSTDVQQLSQIKFIDSAKACSIIAALEIGYRAHNTGTASKSQTIKKPQDVYDLLKKELYKKDKEHLFLVSLNSRSKFIAKDLISIGTVSETLLSPREVFKQSLIRNAAAIILAHNHPSNDPNPSEEDIKITRSIFDLSTMFGVQLVDHIIISENSFVSLKSLGFLKKKGGDKNEN